MSYSLKVNTIAQSSGGGAVTTSAIDTSGSTLFVAAVGGFIGTNPIGLVSDSTGANTWHALGQFGTPANSNVVVQLFYAINPTTSTTQTFSVGAASTFCTLAISAWTSGNTPVLDQSDGGGGPQAPTGVSPAQNFDLMISGLVLLGVEAGTSTINQGFSLLNFANTSGGNAQGAADAYFLDTTGPTAKNPTWGNVSVTGVATAIASFTEAVGVTSWGPLLSDQLNRIVQGN